ncbi:hypothetical protein PV08_08324 [Exophiala spinifera]|uniref:Cell surface protein n=1 Tax=Exophiala spinifera TaxID=91928 RepID=A0A0D1ZJY9_9EURO|nr:uncharacterized protein PV08_08324 [Exophiala spinifera]KIW13137.1 hypothetical protein PV08_08324 [Exophiala spinifera]
MSGLINKAKEALAGNHHDDPRSSNAGPHSSNVANKVDPRVDSDFDHRNDPTSNVGGRGHTQTTGYGAGAGAGASAGYGGANTGYNTAPTTTAGNNIHSSHLANKADPRVDSDFDHRANPTSSVGGYGTSQTSAGYGGQHGHGTTGAAGATGTGGTVHSSNLANKLDPRVDSDRDHRANPTSSVGGYGNSQTTSGYGHSNHNGAGGYGAAPTSGYGQQGHGAGVHDTVTTGGAGYGGHNTGVPANSGYTGTSSTAAGHSGASTHPPHSSDLLNKVDPRVKVDKEGRPL